MINNAGTLIATKTINEAIINETMQVNYYQQTNLTELVLPKMQAGSVIVFVSSMLGKIERIQKNNKASGDTLRKCFDDD